LIGQAAGRAREADVGTGGAPQILAGDVPGQRAAQAAINPVAQGLTGGVPCYADLVPGSVSDVAEIGLGRQMQPATSGANEVRVIIGDVTEGTIRVRVEFNRQPML